PAPRDKARVFTPRYRLADHVVLARPEALIERVANSPSPPRLQRTWVAEYRRLAEDPGVPLRADQAFDFRLGVTRLLPWRVLLIVTVALMLVTASGSSRVAAQSPTTVRIGWLSPGAISWIDVFRSRLRALGWSEGKNLAIDERYTEGHPDRFPVL